MLKFILFFLFINNAIALTKPDVIFIYWDAATVPTDGKPIILDKNVLSKYGLKDLELESVLTRNSNNEESFTLLDYLKENPQDYKEVKQTYDSIMHSIMSGSLNGLKSGVMFSMITASETKIRQVVLVGSNQDAQDTILQAKNIISYFDDVYKELDIPISSLPSNNMINIDTTTANTPYNKCWLIAGNNDQITTGIQSNCIPFFVGDISILNQLYQNMITEKKIIHLNFNDFNAILTKFR